MPPDPIAPARGCAVGLLVSALLWLAIFGGLALLAILAAPVIEGWHP